MTRIISKKFKIFNSIIIFNTVNMVDNFFFFKITTNMFFHDNSMLPNISARITKRMRRFFNKNVSIFIFCPSAFPLGMFFKFSRFPHFLLCFFRKFMTLLKFSFRRAMKSFFESTQFVSHNILLKIKRVAFRLLTKEQLSSFTLLATHFGHKKTVLSLAKIMIAN